MARIVLCTFGSFGDLFPILAIGRELTRRGHSTVVATTPGYQEKVEAAGEIAELLRDENYAARAAEVGARAREEQGVKTACDLLEGVVLSRPSGTRESLGVVTQR